MKPVAGQVVGMILLVLGGQGAIRLLVDHDNSGILGWVSGGFMVRMICYAAITVVGVSLAVWGSNTRTKKARQGA